MAGRAAFASIFDKDLPRDAHDFFARASEEKSESPKGAKVKLTNLGGLDMPFLQNKNIQNQDEEQQEPERPKGHLWHLLQLSTEHMKDGRFIDPLQLEDAKDGKATSQLALEDGMVTSPLKTIKDGAVEELDEKANQTTDSMKATSDTSTQDTNMKATSDGSTQDQAQHGSKRSAEELNENSQDTTELPEVASLAATFARRKRPRTACSQLKWDVFRATFHHQIREKLITTQFSMHEDLLLKMCGD